MLKKSKQCTKRKSSTKIMKWLNSGPKKIYRIQIAKQPESFQITTLKLNRLNSPVEKLIHEGCIKFMIQTASCLQKTHFEPKDTNKLSVKGLNDTA